MPNIPSPISETDEESCTAARSEKRRPAPNFSRLRPGRPLSQATLHRELNDRINTRAVSAFYEPNRDFPSEPRFSLDSEQTTSTSENSAASDFAWDGERGELRTRQRPHNFDRQRVTMESQRQPRGVNRGSSRTILRPPPNEMPAASSAASSSNKSSNRPGMTKTVSFDETSGRVSEDQCEDSRSHHTVSESGDSVGSFDPEGNWQSSSYNYSNLSEAEIRKLKKKGINPALYAEMKAAKKGRNKWIGSLSGNTFLS